METIVTFSRCHPLAYGLLAERTLLGVEVVSPRPVQRSGADSLVDVDVSIAPTVPSRVVVTWIMGVLDRCGPNARLCIDGKNVPGEEMTVARRLASKRRDA